MTATRAQLDSGILQGLHVVAKPSGSKCNIACDYCFYLEKEALYGSPAKPRMSDEVLAKYIDNYVASQPTPVVEFVWQGGEPTLLGLAFFEKVIDLLFVDPEGFQEGPFYGFDASERFEIRTV